MVGWMIGGVFTWACVVDSQRLALILSLDCSVSTFRWSHPAFFYHSSCFRNKLSF